MSQLNTGLYFDYHATTPVDPKVFAAMKPFLENEFGNPSSAQHRWGWKAEGACEAARAYVAKALNAKSKEIVFTSGATESIYSAILGALEGSNDGPFEILSSPIEHKATLHALKKAEKRGARIKWIQPNSFGQIGLQEISASIGPETKMISLLHGHNEIVTLNPIHEIGPFCRERGIIFHVDAAQSFAKKIIDAPSWGIDFVSISGHKVYGPKGVGALFINSATKPPFEPLFTGGGQERGLRGGTHNVPGIVGLGQAARIAFEQHETESQRMRSFREQFLSGISDYADQFVLNGHPTERLDHNINISLIGVSPSAIINRFKDIAFSSSSACSSGVAGSHVLESLNVPQELIRTTMRIGFGRMTKEEDFNELLSRLQSLLAENQTNKSKPEASQSL